MRGFKFRSDIERDINKGIAINKLFAPNRALLNDPSEMNFDDSMFRDFLKKHAKLSSQVEKEYEYLLEFMFDRSGILSLSKEVCNELLWAYYADGHKGFCIEYDTDVILECYNYGLRKKNGKLVNLDGKPEQEPMVLQLDVDYNNSFPQFTPDVMKRLIETGDRTECLTCTIGTKSENWDHEEEIRLIFSKNGLCEFDYRAVKSIYFGSRFDNSTNDIERIMKLLKGRGIKYYQMRFIPQSYTLSYDEIPDKYADADEYIANRLPYNNITILSTPEYTDPYRDLLDQALEIVSKEPCISSIKSARVCTFKTPMIAVITTVNDDFKTFPEKIFRFDMDLEKRSINLRRFQFD